MPLVYVVLFTGVAPSDADVLLTIRYISATGEEAVNAPLIVVSPEADKLNRVGWAVGAKQTAAMVLEPAGSFAVTVCATPPTTRVVVGLASNLASKVLPDVAVALTS